MPRSSGPPSLDRNRSPQRDAALRPGVGVAVSGGAQASARAVTSARRRCRLPTVATRRGALRPSVSWHGRLYTAVSTAGWRLPGRCRAGVRPVRRTRCRRDAGSPPRRGRVARRGRGPSPSRISGPASRLVRRSGALVDRNRISTRPWWAAASISAGSLLVRPVPSNMRNAVAAAVWGRRSTGSASGHARWCS